MVLLYPQTFTMYKDGANYKCDKSFLDGSTGNVSTNTDALTVFNAFKTNAGNSEGTLLIRNGTYDVTGTLSSITGTNGRYTIRGESKYGCLIRPTGDFPVFQLNNSFQTLENLRVYVDVVGYTSNAVEIMAQNAQTLGFNYLDRLHIERLADAQTGAAIGIVLKGTGNSAIYSLDLQNITVRGFNDTVLLDSSASSGAAPWSNDISLFRVLNNNGFNFMRSNQLSGHMSDGWDFIGCKWQTTTIDGTTGHFINFDDAASHHYAISTSNCFAWDLANSNHKFIKLSPTTHWNSFACSPTPEVYIGGTGYKNGANVARLGVYDTKRGQSKFTTDGVTKDFTITPALYSSDLTTCLIKVTPASLDAVGDFVVREDNLTPTQFTVRFKTPPKAGNPVGTQNIILNWEITGY